MFYGFLPLSFIPGNQSFTYLPANFSVSFKICVSYLINHFSVFHCRRVLKCRLPCCWGPSPAAVGCASQTWCSISLGGFSVSAFSPSNFQWSKKCHIPKSMCFVIQLICEIWWHWINAETASHFGIREALVACFLLHDAKGAYSGRSKTISNVIYSFPREDLWSTAESEFSCWVSMWASFFAEI